MEYRDELSSIGRRTTLRRILYACVVRQVIINQQIPLPSFDELYMMPFYAEEYLIPKSELEVDSLRHFLRAVQTMYEMGMPAINNKKSYIEVAGLLDNSNRTYTLGGAPSKATMRRIMIFHTVTGTNIPVCNTDEHQSKRRKLNEEYKRIQWKMKKEVSTDSSSEDGDEVDNELVILFKST